MANRWSPEEKLQKCAELHWVVKQKEEELREMKMETKALAGEIDKIKSQISNIIEGQEQLAFNKELEA